MREYPSNTATHVIGYLGEVNLKKTEEDKFYTKGDLSGVSGVEAAYEEKLRGHKGMKFKLVDVHNRDQGKFQGGKFDTLSREGSTRKTTIERKLQEDAVEDTHLRAKETGKSTYAVGGLKKKSQNT